MKFSWNMMIQVLGIGLQAANAFSPFMGVELQGHTAAIVGAVQGVTGAIAHFRNPDGTPARLPYQPPK